MSYAQGQNIAASDYNSFAGGAAITAAFASSAAATQKVAALLGVGYGDRGYGQSTPSLPVRVAGDAIAASDWANLRTAISTLASHQGTAVTQLPPAGDFVSGANVKAETTAATTSYDFATMIANVDSNRFNTNSGASMTLTSNALTITRASTWGATLGSITAVATATFASEDAARYFFNSGGEVRFAISHPTGSTQDNNWNAALAAVGTVAFKAHATTRTGTAGTPASIGYYELTTADQTVLSGAIGSGAYSTNSISVSARAASVTGVNGAKGSQIIFTITLTDSHTNTFSDICSSGTAVTFAHLKATAVLSGIVSPTFATTTNW
jgi:hypothetical protein